jgi:hypothetical protein
VVYDDFGIDLRGGPGVGVGQLTFETDYPHLDSTWPHTKEYAEKAFAGYTQAEVDQVIRGNAIQLFGLEPELRVPVSWA